MCMVRLGLYLEDVVWIHPCLDIDGYMDSGGGFE